MNSRHGISIILATPFCLPGGKIIKRFYLEKVNLYQPDIALAAGY